jgi:hypothetical protein
VNQGDKISQNIDIGNKETAIDNSLHLGHRAGGDIINPSLNKETIMGDKYIISGQAGVVGKNARSKNNSFQQIHLSSGQPIDLQKLAGELTRLRDHLKKQPLTEDQDLIVADIVQAKKAAEAKDGSKVLTFLKSAGQWGFGVATDIGATLAAEVIKKSMGM